MLAVEMKNITKSFGTLKANDSIHLKVNRGDIHALVGENGAGKTTLMNILYGIYHTDGGEIYIKDKAEIIDHPAKAIKLGIGMVHQHFMLVKPLTVLENIILGQERANHFGFIDYDYSINKINKLTKEYSIKLNLESKIEDLPVGLQQRVEILKILYREADILILDEPTAVLTPQETDELFKTLRNLAQKGRTIILITHKLSEVMSVCNKVTVLRHGRLIGEAEVNSIKKEELATMIVGGEIEIEEKKTAFKPSKNILEIRNLSVLNDRNTQAVKNFTFSVKGGEVLGIAGVEGNGQNELVEAVASLREIHNGSVKINNIEVGFGKPSLREKPVSVYTNTIAHIPEDRQKSGLVLDYSISDNMILGRQREKDFSTFFRIRKNEINQFVKGLIQKFDIKPSNPEQKVRILSGGNQQKVVVARELSKKAILIIANQPTRGLDIKAAEFVHHIILAERNKGNTVMLVSSDLTELLKLSDRIAVIFEGEIAAILDSTQTNEKELGEFMIGSKTK